MFKQYLLVFQSEVPEIIELIFRVHITVQTQVIFGGFRHFYHRLPDFCSTAHLGRYRYGETRES